MLYNQFRYQLAPQTVLTFDYRYSETNANDIASDSTNHYILIGAEHRFSPNTIAIGRVGAQLREVDGPGGDDATEPYAELMFNTRVNEQFMIRSFLRYGMEDYDTVVVANGILGPALTEFDTRSTLRIGVSGEYEISQMLSVFGGLDYIMSDFDDGRLAGTPAVYGGSPTEDLINAYVGLSFKFTQNLFGDISYNFTDSSSDLPARDYDRNRVNVGFRAEF
jgi:predicted porin